MGTMIDLQVRALAAAPVRSERALAAIALGDVTLHLGRERPFAWLRRARVNGRRALLVLQPAHESRARASTYATSWPLAAGPSNPRPPQQVVRAGSA
jgi:hypothetical protein